MKFDVTFGHSLLAYFHDSAPLDKIKFLLHISAPLLQSSLLSRKMGTIFPHRLLPYPWCVSVTNSAERTQVGEAVDKGQSWCK